MTSLKVGVGKSLPAPPNIMGATFLSLQNECRANMMVTLMMLSLVCGCYLVALCLLVIPPHRQLTQHSKKHTLSLVQEKLWAGTEQRGNPGWQLPS